MFHLKTTRNSSNNYIYAISIGIFLIGFAMDIGVNLTGYCLIKVSSSYIGYIFSAITTVSVLCISLVALISGTYKEVFYGYKFGEIVQFPESPINVNKYITTSMVIIGVGMLVMFISNTYSCVNSITALMIALLCIEIRNATLFHELLTNEKKKTDIIEMHLINSQNLSNLNDNEFHMKFNKLIYAIEQCIQNKDYFEKNVITNFITSLSKAINTEQQIVQGKYYQTKINGILIPFSKAFGYKETVQFINKVYPSNSNFSYIRSDAYIQPLSELQFSNSESLASINYFKEIESLKCSIMDNTLHISKKDCTRILFTYFNYVSKNFVCLSEDRHRLQDEFLHSLMRFEWKSKWFEANDNKESDLCDPDVYALSIILKQFILTNENIEERESIFLLIIKYAFYDDIGFHEDKYYEYLSLLFQAFYAYIFCEKETLTVSYRENLKETFVKEAQSPHKTNMKAPNLLQHHITNIMFAIGRRIVNGHSLDRYFENLLPYSSGKLCIWTDAFNIDYLLILYVIYYRDIGVYNICEDFCNWNSTEVNRQHAFVTELLSKFDNNTKLFKTSFQELCNKYQNLLDRTRTTNLTSQDQEKLFDLINEKKKSFIEQECRDFKNNELDINSEEIMEKIDSLMNRDGIIGWGHDLNESHGIIYTGPLFYLKIDISQNFIVDIIQKSILRAVETFIKNNIEAIKLTFDIDGIRNLNNFFKDNSVQYDSRNYTFTDDWALYDLRDDPLFLDVKKAQNKIELVQTPKFNLHIFFLKNEFKFGVKSLEMIQKKPSEEECARKLENSRATNGLYVYEGSLMDKGMAIKFMQNQYQIISFKFELVTTITNENTRYIEFIRPTRCK